MRCERRSSRCDNAVYARTQYAAIARRCSLLRIWSVFAPAGFLARFQAHFYRFRSRTGASPRRTRNSATPVNTPALAERETAENTGFRVLTSVALFCIARNRGPNRTQNYDVLLIATGHHVDLTKPARCLSPRQRRRCFFHDDVRVIDWTWWTLIGSRPFRVRGKNRISS